ncbi:msx2-interacting protein-like [Ambystoma mexicanum]|uniref:msx2-interacting protein-like n=1 Tax=Ambystoma mexicanum TaxID=8296 RepID=UPI0037E87F15
MGDRAPPMGFFEGGRPPRGFDDRFPRGREMAGFGDRPHGPKPLMSLRGGGPEPGMNGAFGPGPRGRPMGPHDGPREPFPGRPFGPRSPSPRGRFDPREPGRPGPPVVRDMVEYIKDRIAHEVEVRRPDLIEDTRRDFPMDMEGRRGDFPRDMEERRGDFPREMEARPRGDFPREMEGRARGDFPMDSRPRGDFPMEGRMRGEFPMEGRPRGDFPREMEGRPGMDIPKDLDARRGDFGRELESRPRGDMLREMEPRRGDFARGPGFPREKEAVLRGDFTREMDPRRGELPRDMDAMRGDFGRTIEGRHGDPEGRGSEWLNELEGRRSDWAKDIDGGRADLTKDLDRCPEWPREAGGRRDWDKELIARRAQLQKEMEGRRGADWLQPRSRSRSPLRHPHPSPMGVNPSQRPAQASKAFESRMRAPDKPLQTHGLKVQNFPVDVPDEVLQQTLFQKFRKYGFVSTVEVHGQGEARYALVFFYHQQDQVDALIKGRRDELLGGQVKITPYIGRESKSSSRPLNDWDEKTDEFHPKASRTLLIINLDRTITPEKLGSICERFGDVLDVEMSRPAEEEPTRSAFVEFCDMHSVCRAGKGLDGEVIGKYRVKTEFGKSIITSCVWLDGLPPDVTQEYLMQRFSRYGQVAKAVYDRLRGRALVLYTRKEDAVTAVQETKGAQISGWRLKVDFASDRVRLTFCRDMEESGQDTGDFLFV